MNGSKENDTFVLQKVLYFGGYLKQMYQLKIQTKLVNFINKIIILYQICFFLTDTFALDTRQSKVLYATRMYHFPLIRSWFIYQNVSNS
jgi:hypothetical protein